MPSLTLLAASPRNSTIKKNNRPALWPVVLYTRTMEEQPKSDPELYVVIDGERVVVVEQTLVEGEGVQLGTRVIGSEGIPAQGFIGTTDPTVIETIRAQLARRALGERDTD